MEVIERKVNKEGDFIKGKDWVDQIFAIRMMAEEYLGKGEKLYAALMDQVKAYELMGKLFGSSEKFYCGDSYWEELKHSIWEASAFLRMDEELNESFDILVGVQQRCVMSPWMLNIFMDGCMREMIA